MAKGLLDMCQSLVEIHHVVAMESQSIVISKFSKKSTYEILRFNVESPYTFVFISVQCLEMMNLYFFLSSASCNFWLEILFLRFRICCWWTIAKNESSIEWLPMIVQDPLPFAASLWARINLCKQRLYHPGSSGSIVIRRIRQ